MSLWWLSYAKSYEEGGFQGVVIIEAPTFVSACFLSNRRKLSPGGQVAGWDLTEGKIEVPEKFKNRLLSIKEIEEFQGPSKSLGELKNDSTIRQKPNRICATHTDGRSAHKRSK